MSASAGQWLSEISPAVIFVVGVPLAYLIAHFIVGLIKRARKDDPQTEQPWGGGE
jgi:hypothetical protein